MIAALGLFVPLVFTVLELSSRYPEEGGVYVWSKRAFGPFAAFITGWTYWGSNLPYFPGLLYFAAANALFIGGPAWQALVVEQHLFHRGGDGRPRLAVTMNVVGLNVGKWLNNVGAVAGWIPAALLIALGAIVVEPLRIGDADRRAHDRAEHQPQGRDLLVDDRVRVRRRRERIDDGRGDPGRAADRAARDPRGRRIVITVLYIVGTLSASCSRSRRSRCPGCRGSCRRSRR